MKKYLHLLIVCSLLVSCHQEQEIEQECCTCESLEFFDVYAFQDLADLPTKPGIWDYPIKPDMEEWKQFQSREEKVSGCQIPEELLSSLSTEDLTNICLRYPLLSDVFVFNDLNYPANRLYNESNGIRELFKRKDASIELLKYYNYLMQAFERKSQPFPFTIPIKEMEFLLGFYTQKADVLSKEDGKKMLQCLLYGHEKEMVHYDPDSRYQYYVNFYARAHVIIKIRPECIEEIPNKDQNGVFHSSFNIGQLDKETWDIINELSYKLIK